MPVRRNRMSASGRSRRVRRRTQRGRGVMDVLKKLHAFVKNRRIASGALSHFGYNKAAGAVRALGYGRRRRVRRSPAVRRRRTRRMRGRGFLSDVWSGIKSAANYVKDNKLISRIAGAIPHPLSQRIAAGARSVGLGRRRRVQRGRGYGMRF